MSARENNPIAIGAMSGLKFTDSLKKLRILKLVIFSLAGFLILTVGTPCVHAQALIEVFCFDNEGECQEILNPNPIVIAVGDNVQWFLDPSCAERPCSGQCRINVPAGPGFPGFAEFVNVPNFSNPTPPFTQEGVFYYELECSPTVIGTIIVGNPFMQLFIQGSCPGSVTLESKQATAGGRVAFAYGFSTGSTPIPGCGGVSVDIANAKLAGIRTANSAGVAKLTGNAPAGVCGRLHVQAAELGTCRKSNVANL